MQRVHTKFATALHYAEHCSHLLPHHFHMYVRVKPLQTQSYLHHAAMHNRGRHSHATASGGRGRGGGGGVLCNLTTASMYSVMCSCLRTSLLAHSKF